MPRGQLHGAGGRLHPTIDRVSIRDTAIGHSRIRKLANMPAGRHAHTRGHGPTVSGVRHRWPVADLSVPIASPAVDVTGFGQRAVVSGTCDDLRDGPRNRVDPARRRNCLLRLVHYAVAKATARIQTPTPKARVFEQCAGMARPNRNGPGGSRTSAPPEPHTNACYAVAKVTDPLPQPTWLRQLHDVLSKVKLPARDIVLAEHKLSVDFAFEPHALTAEVVERSERAAGFAATSRFVVGYRGAGDLTATERHGLELFVRVLRKIEQRLPRLDGVGGCFVTSSSLQSRFLRLFPFCTVERSSAREARITEVMVRTTSRCNQSCPFCTAPEHEVPSASVMRALLTAVPCAFPGAMLSLTGGEPTLRATFLEEVIAAVDTPDIGSVQVQTNAVAFASKLDPAELPPSPKLSFFVSMHALDEPIYDLCTGTRGQLPLAKRGLQHLVGAGHRVTVNCVVNSANIDHLPSLVRKLPDVVPLDGSVDLHFSTLICPDSRPGAADYLVPYGRVNEALREAVAIAESLSLPVQSLRASTHASMPACVLDPSERSRDPHRSEVLAHETGFLDDGRPWVRGADCERCVESRHCLGVPRPYAMRFGLSELVPFGEV